MNRIRSVILLTGVLLALPAQADEAKALKYLKAGISLYDAKDWEAARQAFLQARNEAPDKANPYRWLGLVEAQRGNCGEALGYLDEFLKRAKPDDARRGEVMQQQEKCRTAIANAPPGGLQTKSGSKLTLPQGSPPRTSNVPLALDPTRTPASPTQDKPKPKKVGRWIWAVIAGSAAAAGGITAGVVVGTTRDPKPTQGTILLGGN
jgi:tetratricopeptide (TPR) repeat protein